MRLTPFALLCALVPSIGLTLGGCEDEGARGDTDAALEDCVVRWSPSYSSRFLAGETFFTPRLLSEARCAGLDWSLTLAPEGSSAQLEGEGAERRLTPLVVGDYTLALRQGARTTSITQELEVVDPLERPFHNYNYFPSHHVAARVGAELWVAGVYTPQVARVDTGTGETLGTILTGQWPTALAAAEEVGLVLVANKASDTLGLIDIAARQQTDAIWVGDEPSDIVWDARRRRAYLSLAGAGQLAVVDVDQRVVLKTLDVVFDPLAIAMSPDGSTLMVASHRSGQSNFYPHDVRELESERDIAIIDLETLTVSGHILEVASTIQALHFREDGSLWVTATSNNTEGKLSNPEDQSFRHEIFSLVPNAGPAERSVSVDLSRQPTSGGSTATIHGFTPCGERVWVVAEGADMALELDADLSELRRVPVEGRPRALSCVDEEVWVVSSNRQTVTRISGEQVRTFPLDLRERRSERLKAGLERFTGQGIGTGDNRSCNNCHVDGLSDGVVWNAGPVVSQLLSRPLRWLEGTAMIGWDGYVGSVKISGYVGGATINDRGDTNSALAMGDYLASMMPSPPANSLTRRDGALSEEAELGKALFEGKAACSGCHSGMLFTNQQVMEDGLTEGRTDVPSLVDVARIGSWYKTGIMPTLHDTVADTVSQFGIQLSDTELDAVTRYLRELTGRSFFPLHVDFGPDANAFPVDGALRVTFSFPIEDSEENLEQLSLLDTEGAEVALRRSVEGRHITLTPESPLAARSTYTLTMRQPLRADDGRVLQEERSYLLETASPAELKLEGIYEFSVSVPNFRVGEGGFDLENRVEQSSQFTATATANGSEIQFNYGGNMFYDDLFVIDGRQVITRDLPIALGPAFLNAAPIRAEGEDSDGDGVIDSIEGTLVLSGPGIHWTDISYSIKKVTVAPGTCIPGTEGDNPPLVTEEEGEVLIDWGSEGALALLVTSPDARLPLGPGVVEGGESYWVLSADDFPNTFRGPVSYGVVPEGAEDLSVENGAPLGGAPLESGECYRFSVVTNFVYSHMTMVWP